jgi:hypothetical protein
VQLSTAVSVKKALFATERDPAKICHWIGASAPCPTSTSPPYYVFATNFSALICIELVKKVAWMVCPIKWSILKLDHCSVPSGDVEGNKFSLETFEHRIDPGRKRPVIARFKLCDLGSQPGGVSLDFSQIGHSRDPWRAVCINLANDAARADGNVATLYHLAP